ncbi:MAG: hypothetical protein AAGM22_31520, partial [Acidobacteriota bacterium]
MSAAPLVVLHGALVLLGNPARHVFLAVGFWIAAALAWALAVKRLEARLDVLSLLGVAAVLRLVLLPLPPSLSDDAVRYLWDGRVVASGANPYLLAPKDTRLSELQDDAWLTMPHKHVPTVYPPLALVVFSVAGFTPAPFLVLKIILVLADLVGCWLLARLARRLGAPVGRAAWYAWSPLVTLEVAGQGHVDGLMVPLMIAAVAALYAPARPWRAGAAAAGGVLAKLVPLVLLPIWARTLVDRRREFERAKVFLVATALVLIIGLLPVVASVGGVPPGLLTYAKSWDWNGPLYEPLWRAIDAVDPIDGVKGGLDRLKDWTGWHDFWNRFFPLVYPEFLAKLVLWAGFGLFFLAELRPHRDDPRPPVAATGRLVGALLLTAATVYPWYVLWVLPWAALARRASWLTLAALPAALAVAYVVARLDRGTPATMLGVAPGDVKKRLAKHRHYRPRFHLVSHPINHFGEKVRWVLDLLEAPYEETDVGAILVVLLRGRSVPWLVDRQSHSIVGNSDEIVAFAGAVVAPTIADPLKRRAAETLCRRTAETMRWEADLNALGHALQGFAYGIALTAPEPYRLFGR